MLKEVIQSLKNVYGLTTQEIADRSLISKRTVTRILTGELDNPNMYTLIGLSKCFGVPIDSLCLQRNDRMIRAEEFSDVMLFRSLPPEKRILVVDYLHSISDEWNLSILNSFNLKKRSELHRELDTLSLIDVQKVEEFIRNIK